MEESILIQEDQDSSGSEKLSAKEELPTKNSKDVIHCDNDTLMTILQVKDKRAQRMREKLVLIEANYAEAVKLNQTLLEEQKTLRQILDSSKFSVGFDVKVTTVSSESQLAQDGHSLAVELKSLISHLKELLQEREDFFKFLSLIFPTSKNDDLKPFQQRTYLHFEELKMRYIEREEELMQIRLDNFESEHSKVLQLQKQNNQIIRENRQLKRQIENLQNEVLTYNQCKAKYILRELKECINSPSFHNDHYPFSSSTQTAKLLNSSLQPKIAFCNVINRNPNGNELPHTNCNTTVNQAIKYGQDFGMDRNLSDNAIEHHTINKNIKNDNTDEVEDHENENDETVISMQHDSNINSINTDDFNESRRIESLAYIKRLLVSNDQLKSECQKLYKELQNFKEEMKKVILVKNQALQLVSKLTKELDKDEDEISANYNEDTELGSFCSDMERILLMLRNISSYHVKMKSRSIILDQQNDDSYKGLNISYLRSVVQKYIEYTRSGNPAAKTLVSVLSTLLCFEVDT